MTRYSRFIVAPASIRQSMPHVTKQTPLEETDDTSTTSASFVVYDQTGAKQNVGQMRREKEKNAKRSSTPTSVMKPGKSADEQAITEFLFFRKAKTPKQVADKEQSRRSTSSNQKQNSQGIQKKVAQTQKQNLQRIPKIQKQNDEDANNTCGVMINEVIQNCLWCNEDFTIPEVKKIPIKPKKKQNTSCFMIKE